MTGFIYAPPTRHIDRLFIHCSASDAGGPTYEGEALVRTITSWHEARGWSGVGYHILGDKKGAVMAGRPLERDPAAQKGHNRGTIAYMVHGFRRFSPASLEALRAVVEEIALAHDYRITIHGHREVDAHKTCPVFDYQTLLGLDAYGRLPGAPGYGGAVRSVPLPPGPKPAPEPAPKTGAKSAKRKR